MVTASTMLPGVDAATLPARYIDAVGAALADAAMLQSGGGVRCA